MATINHKTYNEATETFKDFNVYDGKETLIFKVDGSEGKVGIGTTTPDQKLHILGTSSDTAGTGLFAIEGGGGNVSWVFRSTATGDNLAIDREYGGAGSYYNTLTLQRSNGNVGIGNTAPDVSLALGNNASTVNVPAMKIFRGGSTSQTVTYGYAGNAIVNAVGTDYVMQREGTEVARFTIAGLCFGGDYLAPNALDDYEEGTFTPTFEPASGAYATLTYGTNIGKYTKIGNRVDFSLRVSLSAYSAGTASGLLRLSGLPFNCVASYVGSVSFSLVDDFAANRYPIKGFINDTTSYILLRYMTALNTNEDYVNATDITATTTLRISGTYFTA